MKNQSGDELIVVDLRPSLGRRIFSIGRSLGFYFLALIAFGWWQGRGMLDTGSGNLAPRHLLETLSGEKIEIGGQGKINSVLYFFAPWCSVCSANIDAVNELYQKGQEMRDFEVYAIAVDFQSPTEIGEYVAKHDMKMNVLLGDESTSRSYRIHSLPTYYFLNAAGELRAKSSGYTTYLGLLIRLLFC